MKSLKLIPVLIAFIMAILIIACSEDKSDVRDGVWKSIGYGRIVKIDDGEFLVADVTDISCMPIMSGLISDFGDKLHFENDTLALQDGINTFYFSRINEAPAACKEDLTEEKQKDPIYNFEVLANIFKEHYAYFELRNINWDKVYKENRAKVTSNTTDAELFKLMYEMLNSFGDGHIDLNGPDEVEEAALALANENHKDIVELETNKMYSRGDASRAVTQKYIPNGKTRHNNFVRWGMLENNIGYLQINQMMGYADYGIPDSLSRRDYFNAYFEAAENSTDQGGDELKGLKPTLDEVFIEFKDTDAIILDVRFNGGGSDEVGLEIMSRFNDQKRKVFTKQAMHRNELTKPQEVFLKASQNPYEKPVYILTSSGSASATEIMVLSSLLLDNMTRLGAKTTGIFSDILEKSLPNGWELGLSNEVYLDTKGTNYENVGIAPDIDLDYPNDAREQLAHIAESMTDMGDVAIERAKNLVVQ